VKLTFLPHGIWRLALPLLAASASLVVAPALRAQGRPALIDGQEPDAIIAHTLRAQDPPAGAGANDLVPLTLKLPDPAYVGTPKNIQVGPNVEPPSKTPRPPLLVPKDLKNVAPGSKITCSDPNANSAALAKLTDGDKEALDGSILLLRKGVQWVQFDLGAPQEIFALAIWHAHDAPKVFHGVVLQVADDPEMTLNLRTIFNNDTENACQRGAGADREYFETNQGKLIDAKGVKARYVRLYSKGSTDSAMNEYTEVEIYARPAK